MKIFLTGATGFVGHHVAKALAAEGAELRLLTRKSSNLGNLEGIPGETVVGDLSEPEWLKSALGGCDAVVHVAADYRLWIPDPAAMYRANVDGTRELLRLARESAVKRFVYTSSVATMHFRTDGIVINEDTPVSLADMVGHYKRSKFMAEQEAIKAAQGGQQVIILNPTTPIGSNDRKPTPTGRIFVDFLNGKFPAYMDTGLNLVDVSEVARAHVAGADKGHAGPALHSGRRKSDAQADSRQDVGDYRHSVADGQNSLRGCRDLCIFRGVDHGPHSRQGAEGHARRGAHGPQEDVCLERARTAGAGLSHRARSIPPCAPPSTGSAPTDTRRKITSRNPDA